jgi:signal peptidase I
MTADPKRLIAILAAIAVGVVVWYETAPSALGGSADYSITSGISMEPRFSSGDLAVVRSSSAYRVGDIVLYQSPVVHRPVLHRIIKIQDGHYYFKGDNNNFVDPGYVTRSELVGKLWVRVPLAGHVLQWLASPVKASIIAALAVLLLVGGSFGGGKRRRRGRSAVAGLFGRLPVHRLERLPGMPTMAAGGLLVVLAIFVTATGFSTSMTRTGSDPQAMRHTGVFSYSAQTTRPSVAYPSGVVKTGDPIFFSNVDRARFAFSYHFASSKAHVVHGTIGLVAEISSDTTTLTETFPLGKAHGFTGDAARTSYVLPLAVARQFLASLATESGTPGTLTASFRAIVKLRGFVDGEPISETFAPVLPMKVGNTSIEMIDTTPVAPPGATYAPPSPAQAMAAVLHPVQAGAIPVLDQNQVTLLRWRLDVDDARLLAAALWLLGLPLIVVGLAIQHRRPARTEEERIASLLRLMVVPVVSLAAGAERRI